MAKITTLPSIDIIKGLKGKIDYVQRRGYFYARKWPVTPPSHLTEATLSAAQIFGEILAGYRNQAPEILQAFQEMAEGTPNTPRDIYVRAVLGWLHIGSVILLMTIEIQDEGAKVTDASIVNFQGAGVEATEEEPGKARVTIPGPPTPTIEVQHEDVKVTDATIVNFEGAGVEVSEEAPGKATVQIPGGGPGGGNSTYTSPYVSRPAPSKDGDLFLPSDGFYLERDTGLAWVPWGPLYPFVTPINDDFSWINQGNASVQITYGGIYILAPALANNQLRVRIKDAPAPPYSIIAALNPQFLQTVNYPRSGLLWRQSADGKLVTFDFGFGEKLRVTKWADPQTGVANYIEIAISPYSPLFLKIEDDGINRICSFSSNGQTWIRFHSIARTDYLTADQVGFFANSCNATWPVGLLLLSWKEID